MIVYVFEQRVLAKFYCRMAAPIPSQNIDIFGKRVIVMMYVLLMMIDVAQVQVEVKMKNFFIFEKFGV